MTWLFVGDAHFSPEDGERRKRFFELLDRFGGSLGALVIMGDLFDFWFGFPDGSSFISRYADVLEALGRLRARGIRVVYLEGNHDFHLGTLMRDEMGIEVYPASVELEVAGMRGFLSHGDRIQGSLSHRVYSTLLKNTLTYSVMSWLGPRRVSQLARMLGDNSRHRNLRYGKRVQKELRAFALERLEAGTDVVILSHSHIPEAVTVEGAGGLRHYFNVGNWIQAFSYVRYETGVGFSLEFFRRGEGEGG